MDTLTQSNRVYLLDSDPVAHRPVRELLAKYEYQLAAFTSISDFLRSADVNQVGCVVSDAHVNGVSASELLARLRGASSPLATIFLVSAGDISTAVAVLESGAITVLEKPYKPVALIDAVDRALKTSRAYADRRQFNRSYQDRLNSLSVDERAVLRLLLKGAPNKVVAETLQVSTRTVDRWRQAILRKMQIATLAELALLVGRISNRDYASNDFVAETSEDM